MAELKRPEELTAGEHFERLHRGPANNPNPKYGREPRVGEPAPDPTRDELREAGWVRRPKRALPDRSKEPDTIEEHLKAIDGGTIQEKRRALQRAQQDLEAAKASPHGRYAEIQALQRDIGSLMKEVAELRAAQEAAEEAAA